MPMGHGVFLCYFVETDRNRCGHGGFKTSSASQDRHEHSRSQFVGTFMTDTN